MLEGIDVLYHSSIKINKGKVIYIDPFKIDENYSDADIIFITHEPRDGLFVHWNEQKVRPLVHVPWFKRIVKNSSANNGLFSRYMLFYWESN